MTIRMTIRDLQQRREVLNLTALARRAEIPPTTLIQKVRRGTELTVTESRRLEAALRAWGLAPINGACLAAKDGA